MFTLPQRRRKGAGKGLLRALALSARADAMRELYLLVELDNVAAYPGAAAFPRWKP